MLAYLPFVLALALGTAMLLVFIGLAVPRPVDPVQARLERFGARDTMTLEEIELAMPFSERVMQPLISGLATFMGRFTPGYNIESARRQLELAGNPFNWSPADLMGVRGLVALIMGALALGVLILVKVSAVMILPLALVFAVLGFLFPIRVWLGRKISQRKAEILRCLPDALDILTVTVEAGLGFDGAMSKVLEKWDNQLTRSFAKTLYEMKMGKARRQALRDMADSADVPELTAFVAAIIQADQLGVSIARVLHVQSEQMRIRRRQKAEELAHSAPVKMAVILVLFIFPTILIILLGPSVPQFSKLLGGGGVF
jgi:tight adherence protein C